MEAAQKNEKRNSETGLTGYHGSEKDNNLRKFGFQKK